MLPSGQFGINIPHFMIEVRMIASVVDEETNALSVQHLLGKAIPQVCAAPQDPFILSLTLNTQSEKMTNMDQPRTVGICHTSILMRLCMAGQH